MRTIVRVAFVLAVCAAPGARAVDRPFDTAQGRPNILFIYTDDQSHRTVGCYPEAYDWVRTPNIDRLAKRGVRFTHAYVGTWCMPSRATMLTGLHPFGIQTMRMEGEYPGSTYDPARCPFWPKTFRANGYVTAQIGKWHTGTDTGAGRDWDYQVVWNRPRHVKNAGAYYYDQLIEINGAKAKLVEGYSTDNYVKWAVEFIEGRHRDAKKPWYLWLCPSAVHGPFKPAKRHLEAYPGAKAPVPADIYPPRYGKPAYARDRNRWVRDDQGRPSLDLGFKQRTVKNRPIHENTLDGWVRQYHQGVLAIDEGVGRIMAALEKSGQLANTLVVFTSDQGLAWGQHGFQHKLAPYDATIRSPLIVSMPGRVAEGKVCRTPVGGVDLIPTFFRFSGIDAPWKMHGHDLSPLLKNPEAAWPHPALLSLTGALYGADTARVPADPKTHTLAGIPWWVSLTRGHHKYVRTLVADEIEELYDLDKDPEELDNLALKPEHADRLKEYRAATLAELRRTGAPMVDELPPVGRANR